ncbi:MAG: SDR family oxidoreductase [Chlorobium sp.]|nr:SDR family oxidoreductase [Chlorobium sp.]
MILITGASGFVGQALAAELAEQKPVRISVRASLPGETLPRTEVVRAQLSPDQDWSDALVGVSAVVHCAARVHVMNERFSDPLAEFRRVNVDGTLHLARQAAAVGVKRFVFLSSIKVNGEQTQVCEPFTAEQQPNPGDPYGVSKMEAEEGLHALARETGMEVVIIRPPLVYGPGVKANFLTMMRWLKLGFPLPLGAVTGNKRSLVALDNLVNLIVTCLDHPAAANQTFLVSDGESLSTATLLRRMGEALGRPARLIPVPVALLKLGAGLVGKPGVAQRLCGSLEIDISKTRELLGWKPLITVDEGLRRTASGYV